MQGCRCKRDAAINGIRPKRDTSINGFNSERDTTTYYYGCTWKRDAAINSGCVCKGGTAINETAHCFCVHSKRGAAINGCKSKRDTAINGFSLERNVLRST
eukprot:7212673-Pyramimonas_sp.AAC.1